MRILQIILFEILLGYILQAFSVVLGLYAFNRQKIDKKKFVVTSLIMSVVFYVTRLLPVAFGVHTVLNYAVVYVFGTAYLKLPALPTIKANILIIVTIISLELADSFVIASILGHDEFWTKIQDELSMYLIGLPPSLLFAAIILLFYKYNTRIAKTANINDGAL